MFDLIFLFPVYSTFVCLVDPFYHWQTCSNIIFLSLILNSFSWFPHSILDNHAFPHILISTQYYILVFMEELATQPVSTSSAAHACIKQPDFWTVLSRSSSQGHQICFPILTMFGSSATVSIISNSFLLEHFPSPSVEIFSCGSLTSLWHSPFQLHFLYKISKCWRSSDLSLQSLCNPSERIGIWSLRLMYHIYHSGICASNPEVHSERFTRVLSMSPQTSPASSIPSRTRGLTSQNCWWAQSSPSLLVALPSLVSSSQKFRTHPWFDLYPIHQQRWRSQCAKYALFMR